MSDLVILGVGGHARVLIAALELQGITPIGCLAPLAPGAAWPSAVAYLGDDGELSKLDPSRIEIVNGIGSVGSTTVRRDLYLAVKSRGFTFAPVIHPSAIVSAGATLGEGAHVMAGAIVQTGAWIGDNVLVNTGAIIDHDCRIASHCHIATGACLSGAVELAEGVHVGTGAAIIQGIRIGANALIGAGSVVVRDIPPGVTAVGNPARTLPQDRNSC